MPGRTPGSYFFRGSALALAARFTDPAQVIETQAGALLAACGGESSASVKNFKRAVGKEGSITFSDAASRVKGIQNPDGSRHTEAHVTINNVNFLNMVKADAIIADVISDHPASGKTEPYKISEGRVTFGRSDFKNLQIGGYPVKLNLNREIFATHPTYNEYDDIQQRRGKRYSWKPKDVDGVIVTSLVDGDLKIAGKGISAQGHIVTIENFGKIHIAEVIIERGYRRLHMLRFELGSPIVGDALLAGGEGNGTEIWP